MGINEICSCCSCCCVVLSAALRFGSPQVLTFTAVTETDTSECIGCGVCVKRCQFGAREMADGEVVFNSDLCSGCGLCVSTCPKEAIILEKKVI